MPAIMNLLLLLSMAGLVIVFLMRAYNTREWRSLWLEVASLVIFVAFLNILFGFPFSPTVIPKGSGENLIIAVALYICMLLGMFSQYIYRLLDRPKRTRGRWDWGLFIAPVFASPLVFIPLLTAFQDAGIKFENLTRPRLMIFLVAFQNGFFWKEFFDRKQREGEQRR